MASKLDMSQIFKIVYDPTSESLKTVPGSSTSFQIELDADDGDTVAIQGREFNASATNIDNTYASEVLSEFNVSGASIINIFVHTTSTITDPQILTLEISPVDGGDLWFATSLTITPSTTSGVKIMGTPLTNLVAKRARVVTAGAITSGTYDIYVLARG